ncbi:MAG: hypothetical protein OdinLCB4_003305 [Candidatus Odinarchaeum yellowstonii]|uniref:Uncharacterized protein n=1 Tax=Odinarchaeota yellowstonii (strain LCB_4) TaxID=1841599 RepID=A0AAF0IDJ6_ODILC|nr:MAG: hypothetical protein OdinLCB4_003305 [Candidatus Odinarchaeum yellowstonii]
MEAMIFTPVKKTLEDLVLVFKEIGLSDEKITKILIKLGFTEERVKHTMLKLSLLEKIHVSETACTIPAAPLKNSETDLIKRLDEFNTILKNNTRLLEQLLTIITGKHSLNIEDGNR